MSDDGTELYVSKKKTAPPAPAPGNPDDGGGTAAVGGAQEMPGTPRPKQAPAGTAVVGGAMELPGSPRPKPAPIAGADKGGEEDFTKQKPRGVEEDAEVWVDPRKGGAGWTTPAGVLVDGGKKTTEGASIPGAKEQIHKPGEPAVEKKLFEDEDVEVSSSPRREPVHHSGPLFGTGGGSGGYRAPSGGGIGGVMPSRGALGRLGGAAGDDHTEMYVRKPGESNVQNKTAVFTPRAAPSSDNDTMVYTAKSHGNAPPPQVPPAQQPKFALPPGSRLNVLLVGSGAREHAMAIALKRNPRVDVFSVLRHRNPGITKLSTGFRMVPETQVADVVAWAKAQRCHLAVIGPESGLAVGLADALNTAGIPCASPSQQAARIETSKTFMRELMAKHRLPGQLGFHPFSDEAAALKFLDQNGPVWAVKPVGLTGGKGVQVHGDHFTDLAGAKAYVKSVFAGNVGGAGLQFEELARGEEFTLMAFCDGTTILPMPAVQDHKRLYDGDKGPNTGGMGSYAQADGLLPFLTKEDYMAAAQILQGIVDALRAEGTPYVGTIYGQFMLTATGPKVIEVNARFGDPEAMNVLHTLETDYAELLVGMVTQQLKLFGQAKFKPLATVVRYIVPKGYGEAGQVEQRSLTVAEFNIKRTGGTVFYASIQQEQSGVLATLGSRALAVLGEGGSLADAEAACTRSLPFIEGKGLHIRMDIGTPALLQRRVEHMAQVRAAGPSAQAHVA